MKKLITLLITSIILIACSNDTTKKETVKDFGESTDEIVKDFETSMDELNDELYEVTLNEILIDYDKTYELFDKEAAVPLSNIVNEMYSLGVIHNMKDNLLEDLSEEEQDIYGKFIDEVIQLEELVNGNESD